MTLRTSKQIELSYSRPTRAAIVGTGYIADFHALAIKESSGVELVSVCDASQGRAESFAAKWGVAKAFSSFDSMLSSERLDSVHLLTPADAHHALAIAALQSGLHVYIEKPMCISTEEADEL